MGSRIVYGMSRQGMLPGFLGRLHAKRRTPHLAILVGMVLVTGLALSGGIAYLAQATSLLLLVVFAAVNIALIVLKQRPGEPQGRFNVPSIVPALGALVCLGLVAQKVYEGFTKPWVKGANPPWLPQLLSVGIVLVIVALYFVMRPKVVSADTE
jgi:amino acid transporter